MEALVQQHHIVEGLAQLLKPAAVADPFRIELDDSVFAGLDLGKLDASAFVANATGVATSADQRIIYDTDSGQLFYDADGSLGGAAVLFGIVAGHPPLTGADVVVV